MGLYDSLSWFKTTITRIDDDDDDRGGGGDEDDAAADDVFNYDYDVDVDFDVDDIISYMLYRGIVKQLIRKSRDSHLAAEQTHKILFRSITVYELHPHMV